MTLYNKNHYPKFLKNPKYYHFIALDIINKFVQKLLLYGHSYYHI